MRKRREGGEVGMREERKGQGQEGIIHVGDKGWEGKREEEEVRRREGEEGSGE